MVWAYDEETGESDWKPVVRLFRNESSISTTLKIETEDGRIDEITSTPGHKYYLPDNTEKRGTGEVLEHASYEGLSEKWVSAGLLKIGDRVLLSAVDALTGKPKYGKVISVKTEKCKTFTTYNFEVEDAHTYYVGKSSVCVHNAACDWEWGDGGLNSPKDSIDKHFKKHGADMGFDKVEDYIQASKNFAEEVVKARVKGKPWEGLTEGIERYTYKGKVIGLDKFNKIIVSFYPLNGG